jgi:hypothetical protein
MAKGFSLEPPNIRLRNSRRAKARQLRKILRDQDEPGIKLRLP